LQKLNNVATDFSWMVFLNRMPAWHNFQLELALHVPDCDGWIAMVS